MIEFWNNFLHDKQTFVDAMSPLLSIAVAVVFWLVMFKIFKKKTSAKR